MPIKPLYAAALLLLIAAGSSAATQAPMGQHTLHPKIEKATSGFWKGYLLPPVFCGKLVKMMYDPRKLPDGAPTYYDNTTGNVVAACDNPLARLPADKRVTCPPVQWTCH